MATWNRITFSPPVMGGRACICGLRVTVSMVAGFMPADRSSAQILAAYPYLEEEDLREALAYALR